MSNHLWLHLNLNQGLSQKKTLLQLLQYSRLLQEKFHFCRNRYYRNYYNLHDYHKYCRKNIVIARINVFKTITMLTMCSSSHLGKHFPIVDADDGPHHLGEDDHVPQVGLHHVRLLIHLRSW